MASGARLSTGSPARGRSPAPSVRCSAVPAGRALRALSVLATLVASAVAVRPVAASAATTDLSISITDSPDPVTVGADLHYTLTVTSTGGDSMNVTVQDTLPTQVSFGSATPSQGTCTPPAGTLVECSLGTIASNSSATIDLLVAPTRHGTF